jgi:hypothetical protein
MLRKLALLLAAAAVSAMAQTPPVQPDCPLRQYTFTATGTTTPINNITLGCTVWVVAYQATGFTAISLSLEAAYGTSTPISFTSWGGDIVNGVDPQIVSPGAGVTRYSDTSASMTAGYYASFVELNLASVMGSGTVVATIYGYKAGSAGNAGGGGGGSGGSGCPGTVATPCVTGGMNSAGAAVTDYVCDQNAPISISGSGLTQIVALSAGKSIRLCRIFFSSSAQSNVTIEQGTGSSCGTGTTALSGVFQNVLTLALDFTSRDAPVFGAGTAFCLNFASSVTSGGWITYAQF